MSEKKFSRRKDLQDVLFRNTSHAGLWLDKFYNASIETDKVKPEQELVKQVASIKTPPHYKNFFARWKDALKQAGAKTRHAEAQGRLAINLGAESVLETSIALHRTYGVPYIPGSALKGLAASFALQHLEGDDWSTKDEKGHYHPGKWHRELFGTTEQAGCVTFFDALYDPGIPGTGHEKQALWQDIITVHHPNYYQGKNAPPADWDSPTPIPFLTATGKFLIALAGPDEWVKIAFDILGEALYREGVGAKTNSGYGRLLLDGYIPPLSSPSAPGNASVHHPQKPTLKPSKNWPWRKGKISRNQREVIDAEDPTKRYPVDRGQIIPKGFTPPGKADVEYAVIALEDGSQSVWVKKRFYPVPD